MRRMTLICCLAALVAAGMSTTAFAALKGGIGDQNASSFSDPHFRALGVKRPGPLFNRRMTFVIDRDRRILAVIRSETNMDRHADEALTALRTELGLSQEQYAELVGAEVRSVRGWETGEVTCPQARHLARLYRLHGVNHPEQLGFLPRRRAGSAATVGHTDPSEADVLRRDILGLAAAAAFTNAVAAPVARLLAPWQHTRTPAVGAADVARVQQTNQTFYDVDFLIGGGALRPDVLLEQFRKAAGLLHGTFAQDSTREELYSAVAHLGSTVGFMLFDQGQHLDARKVYLSRSRRTRRTCGRCAPSSFPNWPASACIWASTPTHWNCCTSRTVATTR